MSTVDFFDLNSVGSDSHLQFMNWAIVNNGAYDYAADTRGYTYGLVAEYLRQSLGRAIRRDADADRGQRHQARLGHRPRARRKLRVRIPPRVASEARQRGPGALHSSITPIWAAIAKPSTATCPARMPFRTLLSTGKQGRVKYGFGLNAEQELTPLWRAFGRLGWNDGAN